MATAEAAQTEPVSQAEGEAAAEGSDLSPAVARDSLRILPLSMVPLETVALTRARLIKNVYLEGVVEFFRDEATGSGQLRPDELPVHMG